ncbi:MAG: hypothetical protein HQ557_03105 [Bacteroidetes bacterium]|nr:hypothetical protein [Bacteroidota bacterium]
MAKGKRTSENTIGMILLVMNLDKIKVRIFLWPDYFPLGCGPRGLKWSFSGSSTYGSHRQFSY